MKRGRFTDGQVEAMRATRGTFLDLVGPHRFDEAVAAMRDELATKGLRRLDDLFAVLEGAALLIKLVDQYDAEVPPTPTGPGWPYAEVDVDAEPPKATDFAFGVLAALVLERLPDA